MVLTPGLYLLRALGAVLQWQAVGPHTEGVRFFDLTAEGSTFDPWDIKQESGAFVTELLAGMRVDREVNLTFSVWSVNGTAEVGAVKVHDLASGFISRGVLPHLNIEEVGFAVEGCRVPDWGIGTDLPLAVAQGNGVIFNLMSAMKLQFGGSTPVPNPIQVHVLTAGIPARQFRYRDLTSGCEDLFTLGQLQGTASFVVYTDKTFRLGPSTLRLKPGYYLAFRPNIKSVFDLAFCSPDVPGDTKRNWGWTPIDYGRWPVQIAPFGANENYGWRGSPLVGVQTTTLSAEVAEEAEPHARASEASPTLAGNASQRGA